MVLPYIDLMLIFETWKSNPVEGTAVLILVGILCYLLLPVMERIVFWYVNKLESWIK